MKEHINTRVSTILILVLDVIQIFSLRYLMNVITDIKKKVMTKYRLWYSSLQKLTNLTSFTFSDSLHQIVYNRQIFFA